jgi:hypothetical protein
MAVKQREPATVPPRGLDGAFKKLRLELDVSMYIAITRLR